MIIHYKMQYAKSGNDQDISSHLHHVWPGVYSTPWPKLGWGTMLFQWSLQSWTVAIRHGIEKGWTVPYLVWKLSCHTVGWLCHIMLCSRNMQHLDLRQEMYNADFGVTFTVHCNVISDVASFKEKLCNTNNVYYLYQYLIVIVITYYLISFEDPNLTLPRLHNNYMSLTYSGLLSRRLFLHKAEWWGTNQAGLCPSHRVQYFHNRLTRYLSKLLAQERPWHIVEHFQTTNMLLVPWLQMTNLS